MKIREIYYTKRYKRKIRKISYKLREHMRVRMTIFNEDCFDERLKTHKLHGEMKGFYSFSITYKHRIVFKIIAKNTVEFIDIGTHSIYQ